MIVSMTGFAAVAADLPGASIAVELRSVNHRYLDVTVKLPDELRSLESSLRERLAGGIDRGKVECRVAWRGPRRVPPASRSTRSGSPRWPPPPPTSRGWCRVRRRFRPPRSCAGRGCWPSRRSRPRSSPAACRHWSAAALADLNASRAREGAKLAAMLDERCAAIEAQVARVAPRIPAIHAAYVEKLGARLREAGADPDEDRLKQELALFATKIDVAEEVSRLGAHVAEVRRVLAAGGSAGKRLDFLMQELHREANTLGSKSVDTELSQASLELKVLIEQMREQVQNIE